MGVIKKHNHSKQRDRILQILRNTKIHPTADWLYNRLKEEFPNLSMGTVYRNLNILLEQGLIKKLPFGSTFDRFEADITPHHHFICKRCKAVYDVDVSIGEPLSENIVGDGNFEIESYMIMFYGLCENCKKAHQKSKNNFFDD